MDWHSSKPCCSGSTVQFSSVAQLCPTLCDPMNRSTPGFLVHPNSRSTPKPMSIESVMPSNHLILYHPLLLPSIFTSIWSFQMSQLFTSGGQSIGLSASTSVLPMSTQDWSPLGWTGWVSLQPKRLKSLLQHHNSKHLKSPLWKQQKHSYTIIIISDLYTYDLIEYGISLPFISL